MPHRMVVRVMLRSLSPPSTKLTISFRRQTPFPKCRLSSPPVRRLRHARRCPWSSPLRSRACACSVESCRPRPSCRCDRCAGGRSCSRSAWSDRIWVFRVTCLVCFACRFISAQGFADDALQRYVFLDRELAAVVVLRRDVQDAAVHARNLDAHLAKIGRDTDKFARQSATLCPIGARSESSSFHKNQGRQGLRVLRFAQNGQQNARTVFLHLHRRGVNI